MSEEQGRSLNLRGVNARIVEAGTVREGDRAARTSQAAAFQTAG